MSARISLSDSVQFIKGVGPVRARLFARLGVETIGDLIEYFPFRHELRPKSAAIGRLHEGETATIVGEARNVRSGRGRGQISAVLEDGTGKCRLRWFNSGYLADRIHHGTILRVTGKVTVERNLPRMTNPVTSIFEDGRAALENDEDQWESIYPAANDLDSRQIGKTVTQVIDQASALVEDFLPTDLKSRYGFEERGSAIRAMHMPEGLDHVGRSRQRLAYDEFLLSQLALLMGREQRRVGPPAPRLPCTELIDRRIRARLPFELTAGQNGVITEITTDLDKHIAMNRLLQGDVGSGKTAVAIYAALVAIANQRQVALLAPTEVVARQHFDKIARILADSRVRIGYLAGSTRLSERRALLADNASGSIDLLVGTHALLEDDVKFRDLALLIIDEQHKFGVRQRAALRSKGQAPHCLVLTATPIPRTLAMTVYGELDVSSIRGVLPGRKPVKTHLVGQDGVSGAWSFVKGRLRAKEQAFVVYPLIDESEQVDAKSAIREAEALPATVLSGFRVGLLHGRMARDEKSQAMKRFRDGEIDVLVTTTVIEVGVDIPNATIMIVQHAGRYGLSQLHQLRGRVGRNDRDCHCFLFHDRAGGNAAGRLRIMAETCDGFRLAEEDLRQRGPGELLGTRQHGLPEFKVANLVGDFALLEQARDDAADLLRRDPSLSQPGHRKLRRAMLRSHGAKLQLIDVA
ncbi:MAG: ATP-dependent DNA helicase RecG [Planctomycetota bacterium]